MVPIIRGVSQFYRAYTRGNRRRNARRDDRPVYTLQAIVAAMIANWLLDYTGVRCRNDRL